MAWIIRSGSLLVGRIGPALDLTPISRNRAMSPILAHRVVIMISDPGGDIFASPGAEDDHIFLDGLLQPLEVPPGVISALHRAEAENRRLRFVRSHELAVGNLVENA